MALGQHGRDGVVFCGEIEQRKIVGFGRSQSPTFVVIYGRKFIFHWVTADDKVLESQCVIKIQLRLRVRVSPIAVVHLRANVHAVSRQSHVVTVGCRTHRKHKTATCHELSNPFCYCQFTLRDFRKTERFRQSFAAFLVLPIPRCVGITAVKFAVLTRKIFVMQVQPVIQGEFSFQNFAVINDFVGNFGIRQDHRYGIVPRLNFLTFCIKLRRINRNLRRDFELNIVHIHLWIADFALNTSELCI